MPEVLLDEDLIKLLSRDAELVALGPVGAEVHRRDAVALRGWRISLDDHMLTEALSHTEGWHLFFPRQFRVIVELGATIRTCFVCKTY